VTRSVFNHRRGLGFIYRQEVLKDQPILYWRLAELSGTSAADTSGNGHTGTYNPGSGTITLGVTSPITSDPGDKAITFAPGTALDCYAISAASTAFDTASMSMEAWVKPTSGQSNKHGVAAVMNGSPGFPRRWYVRIQATTGDIEIFAGGTITGTANISFDVWTHLVVTFDSSDSKFRIYFNGSLVSTTGVSSLAGSTNIPFSIGHNNGSGSGAETFVGSMDEVALYGTVLSSTRIAIHYAAAF
jgi:hypothetical protein